MVVMSIGMYALCSDAYHKLPPGSILKGILGGQANAFLHQNWIVTCAVHNSIRDSQ